MKIYAAIAGFLAFVGSIGMVVLAFVSRAKLKIENKGLKDEIRTGDKIDAVEIDSDVLADEFLRKRIKDRDLQEH